MNPDCCAISSESCAAVFRRCRLRHSKSSNPPRLRHRVKAALRTRNIGMVLKTTAAAGAGMEILSAAIRAARKLQARGRIQAQDRVAEREASASRSGAASASRQRVLGQFRNQGPQIICELGTQARMLQAVLHGRLQVSELTAAIVALAFEFEGIHGFALHETRN